MFEKIDLDTGLVTNINYIRDALGEKASWDVAIASNGLALGDDV